jgi:hypothetical protein
VSTDTSDYLAPATRAPAIIYTAGVIATSEQYINTKLQISSRIFIKLEMAPTHSGARRELIREINLKSKISF